MKEVNSMRYLRTTKRSKAVSVLKIIFSVTLTVTLSFSTLKYFGNSIAQSAFRFTFSGQSGQTYSDDTSVKANYESEFLTFLNYAEEENDPEPAASPQQTNINAVTVNLSALSGKYKTYNGTSVINNTDYSITDLLNASYTKPELDTESPYILIYHTHTSEEYYGGGTVVDVGNAMAEEFERLGYKTVHLTEVYDKEQFSGSYSRSVKGAQAMLEKYPTVKLVFDIHRDAITTDSGVTYQPLTVIDGENCAQVMFVCGTDEKGLTHPNWRENFKFALDVSRTIGKNYSALSRPVNLRGDRFNTHLTDYSFLIEVGSSANTVDEAKRAAVYTARSIIDTVES